MDTTQLNSILRAIAEDIVYVEEDDVLEDALFSHTFDKKEFLYAISMKVKPTLFCVGLLLSY